MWQFDRLRRASPAQGDGIPIPPQHRDVLLITRTIALPIAQPRATALQGDLRTDQRMALARIRWKRVSCQTDASCPSAV